MKTDNNSLLTFYIIKIIFYCFVVNVKKVFLINTPFLFNFSIFCINHCNITLAKFQNLNYKITI